MFSIWWSLGVRGSFNRHPQRDHAFPEDISIFTLTTLSMYNLQSTLNALNVPPHVIHHVHVPDDPTDVSIPTISTVPEHSPSKAHQNS